MNDYSVTELTHAFRRRPSRRDIVRGLAGAGLGFGVLPVSAPVMAKKKHKHRKNKHKGGDQPPPPSPFAGTCSVQRNRCTVTDPLLATCNLPDEYATCLVTTAGTPFCGSLFGFSPAVHCQSCRSNADCTARNFPPGTACVQLGGTFCNGCEATDNHACFPPAVSA